LPDGFARFVDGAPLRWTLRVLGLAVFVYLGWALLAGPDVVTNPVFGSFYVLLWVGIVPFSLLFGPIFRAVSPMRTVNLLLARGTGGDPARGVTGYPPWLGYWPAAVGLFGFVWQELVNESSTFLGTVRLWLALYVGAMLVGSALFGSTWFKRADPFEVYSTLIGGSARSVGAETAGWCCAVRSPTSTASRSPRAGGGDGGAPRQHRLRQLQGQDQLGRLRQPDSRCPRRW
jgi:hypothetical protein